MATRLGLKSVILPQSVYLNPCITVPDLTRSWPAFIVIISILIWAIAIPLELNCVICDDVRGRATSLAGVALASPYFSLGERERASQPVVYLINL